MSVQPNLLALTLAQITDIAAYIATFVAGAPANYQGLWWNAGEFGVGLGHQPRASGRHGLRLVVHLRHDGPRLVAGDDGDEDGHRIRIRRRPLPDA